MGNKCWTPKVTPVIECIQELQKVEKTLQNLIDKYTKQIREQTRMARAKMYNKPDAMQHIRTIKIIKMHPHIDSGDFVVVLNAAQIAVTGKKEEQKKYYRHSGFPGGLKVRTLGELRETFPERIIEKAVKNMLPKNKLQSPRMARLKVFAGAEHPHQTHFKK